MLVLLCGNGELDFLPVWPEAIGLLSGRYTTILARNRANEKLVPHDVTKEHELFLLCPDPKLERAPWIFQVQVNLGPEIGRTFTLDKIVESWVLRVDTSPRTRFFLPDYQPTTNSIDPPQITDVIGRPKPGTVWDRIGG